MTITYRSYLDYDRPIHIHYLSVFVHCLFDDVCSESERRHIRLFDDEGNLIGRAATYEGV